MLSLATPWWLLALPLPWLAWLLFRNKYKATGSRPALRHPQTELLAQLSQEQSQSSSMPLLWLLGCSLLLLALARPQWFDNNEHQGRNFLLAIDVSGSMRAQDFQIDNQPVSRLDMVKRIIDQFLSQRSGDRVGLLVFGNDVFTLVPMTTDLNLVRYHLQKYIANGMAGEKTALGEAIAMGVKRLQQQKAESRILILLTDGTNSAGQIHPLNALEIAKTNNVRIYPVGIGSNNKVMFPRGPVEGNELTELPLDETLLQQLAEASGGFYQHAEISTDLGKIISAIEAQETIAINDTQAHAADWYAIPLALGLILLLIAQWRGPREVLPC